MFSPTAFNYIFTLLSKGVLITFSQSQFFRDFQSERRKRDIEAAGEGVVYFVLIVGIILSIVRGIKNNSNINKLKKDNFPEITIDIFNKLIHLLKLKNYWETASITICILLFLIFKNHPLSYLILLVGFLVAFIGNPHKYSIKKLTKSYKIDENILNSRYILNNKVLMQKKLESTIITDDSGRMQCPTCRKWDVKKAYIEDGSIGEWCPHCKKSIQQMVG